MAIEVLAPGLLTTVQDMGRTGYAAEGYPECGACDKAAFALANLMAGNDVGEAALECTLLGPTLRFTAEAIIAVTRAEADLNGVRIPESLPVLASAGDTLSITGMRGARGYLAVHGGLDVPLVRGSRSTDLRCGIGGYRGRALIKGDCIPTRAVEASALYPRLWARAVSAGRRVLPDVNRYAVIRVIPGPQAERFTEAGRRTFYSTDYVVTPDSNRMGLRLSGKPVESVDGVDILSDAIVEGSVQVSANGLPIVMLADHQTTGGYAKIATVIPNDIPRLAQLVPGSRIWFVEADPDRALAEYREAALEMKRLRERMDLSHDARRFEFRFGRKLRRLHPRYGRGGAGFGHLRQRGLRLPRR